MSSQLSLIQEKLRESNMTKEEEIKEEKSRIDTCKICLLSQMKDCPLCKFNIGLQYKEKES